MPTVRPISQSPAMPYLANITSTDITAAPMFPRAMSADRRTVYAVRASTIVKSTNDGTNWTTVYTHNVDSGSIKGFWILANGEAIYSTKIGSQPGKLYYSTGFAANDTAANWTECAGVNCVKSDSYVHEAWGLSFAPAGHPREGLVVATEYGSQGGPGETDDSLSPRIWASTDYGKTFKLIGNLYQIIAFRSNQHMHGIIYDPWFDSVVISFGDGGGAGSKTGTMVSHDFLSANPTWSYIHGPVQSADFQVTTLFPTSSGLIASSDGIPPGIYRFPRRGYRLFGEVQTVLNHGGGTDGGWIGLGIYQHSPGKIILISHLYTKSVNMPNIVNASIDGVEFFELWRDESVGSTNQYPSSTAVGPTASGKVLITIKNTISSVESYRLVTGELVMPPKP